ncbi:uncharacterized protein LOC112892550 [Panicum hallii]|uniref:uncharacterized protein LOC112892550 n=1 Tax=Panicum hallii TaxID=206008 RepID=UPI000DF4EC15|nr:uncharacterized protein LOC112892550 [Panicum hallii]
MLQQIHPEYDIPAGEQEDGPEPMNEDGSPFCFRAVAPVVLFGRNAPPPSKSVMQIQPSTVKLTPKRKRLSEAAAPRARTKTRKILVKKVRKEAAPSSPNPSSPVINQPAVVEVSSGEEPPCQKGSSSEVPEDVDAPIRALITLRDPGATILEDPSVSAVVPAASPSLQAPVVTTSLVGPCLKDPLPPQLLPIPLHESSFQNPPQIVQMSLD